jgi:hypothetical protein
MSSTSQMQEEFEPGRPHHGVSPHHFIADDGHVLLSRTYTYELEPPPLPSTAMANATDVFPPGGGLEFLTFHSQRRGSVAAPPFAAATPSPASTAENAPDSEVPFFVASSTSANDGIGVLPRPSTSYNALTFARAEHQVKVLVSNARIVDITQLARIGFVSGIAAEPGRALVAVSANPIVVLERAHEQVPRVHTGPRVLNPNHDLSLNRGGSATPNAIQVLYNAVHRLIIVFAATQEGGVFALTKKSSQIKFRPQFLFHPGDMRPLFDKTGAVQPVSSGLPKQNRRLASAFLRAVGGQPAAAADLHIPNAYCSSMNDVTVRPFGATQFLIACPKDGDFIFFTLVALRKATRAERILQAEDDDADALAPIDGSEADEEFIFDTVLTQFVHVGGQPGCPVDPSVVAHENTGLAALKFFTYAAFSEHGEYLCATNDNGHYCAFYRVKLEYASASAAAGTAPPGEAAETLTNPTGVTLTLEWVAVLPKDTHDEPSAEPDSDESGTDDFNSKSKPYTVASVGGAEFAVLAGRRVWLLDPRRKTQAPISPLPESLWRGGPYDKEYLLGLASWVFDRRHIYCANTTHIAHTTLRPQHPVDRLPSGASLFEAAQSFVMAHRGHFGDVVTTLCDRWGLDAARLLSYCPYGHTLTVLRHPVACLAEVPGFAAPLSPADSRCSGCSRAIAADENAAEEQASEGGTPNVLLQAVCHQCGYALCVKCARRTAMALVLAEHESRGTPQVRDIDA